jgi:ABC-type glycerol-3-phosphate transport system permease component
MSADSTSMSAELAPLREPLLVRARMGLLTSIAVVVVFVIVFPFLWIFISSFKDPQNFLSLHLGDALPHSLQVGSYRLALG